MIIGSVAAAASDARALKRRLGMKRVLKDASGRGSRRALKGAPLAEPAL